MKRIEPQLSEFSANYSGPLLSQSPLKIRDMRNCRKQTAAAAKFKNSESICGSAVVIKLGLERAQFGAFKRSRDNAWFLKDVAWNVSISLERLKHKLQPAITLSLISRISLIT